MGYGFGVAGKRGGQQGKMGGRREGLTVGSEDCIFVAGDARK